MTLQCDVRFLYIVIALFNVKENNLYSLILERRLIEIPWKIFSWPIQIFVPQKLSKLDLEWR